MRQVFFFTLFQLFYWHQHNGTVDDVPSKKKEKRRKIVAIESLTHSLVVIVERFNGSACEYAMQTHIIQCRSHENSMPYHSISANAIVC